MKDDNAYTGAHLLISFLAGAATGAAVALLMAPQSGTESRTMIKGWAHDAQDKAARVPRAVKSAYSEATSAAKKAFADSFAEEQQEPVGVESS
jgi:gas vesicle protein